MRTMHRLTAVAAAAALFVLPSLGTAGSVWAQEPADASDPAAWNGFWYSRYVVDYVALYSGLGPTFSPPDAHMDQLVAAAGGTDGGAAVQAPSDARFLEAVFAGAADPQPGTDAADPEAAGIEPVIDPAGQALLILAETEWAKILNDGSWAGAPGAADGAAARLRGQLYVMAAKAQADYALTRLRHDGGPFLPADWAADGPALRTGDPPALLDQLLMLQALSSLVGAISPDGPHGDVYGDEALRGWFATGANAANAWLADQPPATAREAAVAIQALRAYVATIDEPARVAVENRMQVHADWLGARDARTSLELARVVTGLAEHVAHTGDEPAAATLDDRVAALLVALEDEVFSGAVGELTAGEVAELVGSLNAYERAGPAPDRVDAAEGALLRLVDELVSRSRLMRSVPEPGSVLDAYEFRDMDDALLRHPDVHRATDQPPVFAAGIRFDESARRWSAADSGFETANALHAALELMRIIDVVPPPSPAPLGGAAPQLEAPGSSRPAVVNVTAGEFSFDPSVVTLPAGAEVVVRLDNRGVAPHNVDAAEVGLLVEAAGGAAAEMSFTVPDEPGREITFLCNIPGHAEAGMRGTFRIVAAAPEPDAAGGARQPLATEGAQGGAIFLPPETVDGGNAAEYVLPAVLFAAGLVLAVMVLVTGMLRFARDLDG